MDGLSLGLGHLGILGQVWYLIVSIPDICTLTYFVVGLWLVLGQEYRKTSFPLVRIRANIEKNILCGRPLVRIRAKIKIDPLCGRPLVRVRTKIENNTLCSRPMVRVRARY